MGPVLHVSSSYLRGRGQRQSIAQEMARNGAAYPQPSTSICVPRKMLFIPVKLCATKVCVANVCVVSQSFVRRQIFGIQMQLFK